MMYHGRSLGAGQPAGERENNVTTPDRDALLAMFREEKAILDGHFLLSSGLHSPLYLQCARVLCRPDKAAVLGGALAAKVRAAGIAVDSVVSPAIGGIIIGHEVGRALGVRALFTERAGGEMSLRRGFAVEPGERVLVVEDVLTTGGSTREVTACLTALGARPSAASAIVFRGGRDPGLGLPFFALLELAVPSHQPADCPQCLAGSGPAVKPGSRGNY
jgi:orotate phosphoribosyltransferase